MGSRRAGWLPRNRSPGAETADSIDDDVELSHPELFQPRL